MAREDRAGSFRFPIEVWQAADDDGLDLGAGTGSRANRVCTVRPAPGSSIQRSHGSPTASGEVSSERREVVVARGVVLSRGGRTLVAGLSFECSPSTVTAVIGPNGSGKTTLLDAIVGLVGIDGGELYVLGRAPGSCPRSVAYVLQDADIAHGSHLTVAEVVRMGCWAGRPFGFRPRENSSGRVRDVLERLDLDHLRLRRIGELSGGERQRVMIAQGLVQDAEVLLLDEPHTALDPPSRDLVDDVIAHERDRGRCILMATHDLGEARRAGQVVLLGVAGVSPVVGSPERVMEVGHLKAAYGHNVVHLDEGGTAAIDDPHH